MFTHGGLPTHMILNPEPNLRPIPARASEPSAPANLVRSRSPSEEDDESCTIPIRSSTSGAPTNPSPTPVEPPSNLEARPFKKKQRVHVEISQTRHEVITAASIVTPDGRPIDHPTSADEDDSASDPVPLSLRDSVPSAVSVTRTEPPPDSSREPDHEPAIPMATINSGLRPWSDIADNELISYKMDSQSRPSWKTIGLRLKHIPESCKAPWLWLKNTRPDLNTRTENDAED